MQRIIRTVELPLSEWVTLVTRTVVSPHFKGERDFHSLSQADYVATLAVTTNNQIPLVRQFRPALQRHTLELPGGLREADEDPESTAIRELWEETGYRATQMQKVGCYAPDPGRLENKLFAYFAEDIVRDDLTPWKSEDDVEIVLVSIPALRDLVLSGTFDNASHIAIVGAANIAGFLKVPSY